MKKKHLFLSILAVFGLILMSGCTTGIETEINNLAKRVTDLETYCSQLNSNITALQTIASALKSQNYIQGVADYKVDGVKVGYQITLSNGSTIVIYNGQNGKNGTDGLSPVIGVAESDDGNLYWTIAYGTGSATWLYDISGNKILAVGVDGKNGTDGKKGDKGDTGDAGKNGTNGITPQMKIVDGYWFVSTDNGASWTKVGQATGNTGDAIFSAIDTSNPDYVVFTMSGGSKFSVPTVAAYESILDQVKKMTDQITAINKLADSIYTNSIFVSKITANISGKDTTGFTVLFSDGSSIILNRGVNGKDGVVPTISAAKDADGVYYWTLTVSGVTKWMFDANGNKVQAAAVNGKTGTVPVIGVKDSSGVYYWTASYNGSEAVLIRDTAGNAVRASSQNGAAFFANVDVTSGEYAVFTMTDGSTVKIPLYASYEKILKLIDTANANVTATKALVAAVQNRTYVKSVETLVNSGDTLAYTITLSNGSTIYLYNGVNGVAPVMSVAKDTDGFYYWTVKYGNGIAKWVYDTDGNKVKAVATDGKNGATPQLGVTKDSDGVYYWTVIVGTDTSYVKDSGGNKIAASGKNGKDGTSFLSSLKTDADFMTLVLADGTTTFKIPVYKEFSLSSWKFGTATMSSDYTISTVAGTTSYVLDFVVSCSYITKPDIQYYASSGIGSVTVGTTTFNSALSTHTGAITVTFVGTPVAAEQKLILFIGDGNGKVIMRTVKFN
jgi:outer membrane murein-binding lipoprotein Lpp